MTTIPVAQCLRQVRDGQVTKRLHLILRLCSGQARRIAVRVSRMILLSAVRAEKSSKRWPAQAFSDLDCERQSALILQKKELL